MLPNKIIDFVARQVTPKTAQAPNHDIDQPSHIGNQLDANHYIEIEDRGSDVTIITFAGLAVLYCGMPAFEFKKLLRSNGNNYNLIFLRDVHRLNYHASPTLGVNGLTFYEQTINEALEKMGSTYNVGIGISVGGAAALYFGSRCEFDQVIAFSPVCPISEYCSLFNQIRSIFDFPRLFTAPKSYLEQLIVTLATAWSYRRTVKLVGKENFWPVLEEFRDSRRQPKTTILYGTRTGPDARQAKHFNAFPQVKQIGLDTNSHNGAGFLKQQGTLASTLLDEIQAGIAAKQAEQDNQTDKLGLSKPRSA